MTEITTFCLQTAFEMLLFGVLGLGLEVIFTSAFEIRKVEKRHLMGYSSLWYLPLYMLTPLFLIVTSSLVFPRHILIRGLIYMTVIFVIEYTGMFLLRKLLGSSPSEASYHASKWNIHGLIRLDYAPAMFLMGLIFEFVYRQVH